jgi:hypothetical protein
MACEGAPTQADHSDNGLSAHFSSLVAAWHPNAEPYRQTGSSADENLMRIDLNFNIKQFNLTQSH